MHGTWFRLLTRVDHWHDLSSFHQIEERGQVCLLGFRQELITNRLPTVRCPGEPFRNAIARVPDSNAMIPLAIVTGSNTRYITGSSVSRAW